MEHIIGAREKLVSITPNLSNACFLAYLAGHLSYHGVACRELIRVVLGGSDAPASSQSTPVCIRVLSPSQVRHATKWNRQ
jgi:hypothetical protein